MWTDGCRIAPRVRMSLARTPEGILSTMCGRYTLKSSREAIAQRFDVDPQQMLAARFNIAPGQSVPVVRVNPATHQREWVLLRWGLVPSWADEPAIGNRLVNARSETAATKPAFRSALRARRCLVVADGFYEWQARDGRKQPSYIQWGAGGPIGFGGLWERWEKSGTVIESCTILTCAANDTMQPIHHRMPVVIPPEEFARWLDPTVKDVSIVSQVMCEGALMELTAYPVSTFVNSVRNDSSQCVKPYVPPATLF